MWRRCSLPNSADYPRYGGRGISVCGNWQDFAAFLEDVGPRPGKAYSLDRIDNDRGYEPGNVRWATKQAQARNRRTNHLVTAYGETLSIAEWGARYGLPTSTIRTRLARGVPPEEALSPMHASHHSTTPPSPN
jgi:hypothetical protein